MVTTLEEGDRVLVNKLSYHLHDVHRGDIVVFSRPPSEPDTGIEDYIKRVIGLPGDVIDLQDCHVTVNGQVLNESYVQDAQGQNCTRPLSPSRSRTPCPAGDVWVMGDNRGVSVDSRHVRRDPREHDRGTRLPAHLAAQPPRLLVAGLRSAQVGSGQPLGGEGVVHPVDPVAEHTVDAHAQDVPQQVLVLQVPGERVAAEAVEQRREPAGPVGVVEVDGIDPASASSAARRSGPSFILARRVESTSFTSASSGRSAATTRQSGWHSQSRGSRAGATCWTVRITASPASACFRSSERW